MGQVSVPQDRPLDRRGMAQDRNAEHSWPAFVSSTNQGGGKRRAARQLE
jgi:hypothetical protein